MSIYTPRNERDILLVASRSKLLPTVAPGHEKQLIVQKERLDKVKGVEVANRRKKDAQERYNYKLELERLKGISNTRTPGLRGVMARIGQLEQLINRANLATQTPSWQFAPTLQ